MDRMAKPQQKKKMRTAGLQLTAEDLTWLKEASNGGGRPIPPFNKSRLIAHGLVEATEQPNGRLLLTEKGKNSLGRS